MRQRQIFLALCTLVAGLAVLLIWPATAGAQTGETSPLMRAAEWVVTTHQNSDGGYSNFSQAKDQAASDVPGTLDAILALSGAGLSASEPLFGASAAPLAYLQANNDALSAYAAQDGSSAGKIVLALAAAGQDPRAFGGVDYVLQVTQQLSPTGQFGVNTAFGQSLAILGLRAAGADVPPAAIQWLLEQQAREGDVAGSWDDGFGVSGNPDATGMALMALVGAEDPTSVAAVSAALAFLEKARTPDGGWGYGPDQPTNVNSTALAIQGLIAAGVDVEATDTPFAANGLSPLTVLRTLQNSDGAFQNDLGSGPVDDFFTTVQAIPALAGQSLPLQPVAQTTPTAEPTPETSPTPTPAETTAQSTTRTFIIAVVVLTLFALVIVAVGSRLGRRSR